MLLLMVRDDLVELSAALDEIETTRNEGRLRRRYAEALAASRRSLREFMRNDDLANTMRQARDVMSPYAEDASSVVSDAMLFGAFIQAERRLLVDLGASNSAVDRLTAEMHDAGAKSAGEIAVIEDLQNKLSRLQSDVTEMQKRIKDQEENAQSHGLLRRIFLATGGSFIVGANALVGAGAAPVTGGLSIVGAAVSAGLGTAIVAKAFD